MYLTNLLREVGVSVTPSPALDWLVRDYHTATGVTTAARKVDLRRTLVSPRYYLSDAAFVVGLEGIDTVLLDKIRAALRMPTWPLALGREAFPPGLPVWLENDLVDTDLRSALLQAPLIAAQRREHKGYPYRLILEHGSKGSVRLDQPLAPFPKRRFGPRYVASEVVDAPF